MFQSGDRVRFRYTGDFAEIIEDHLDGSYTVWLEADREESIAFYDDIVPEANFSGVEQSEFIKKHKKKKPQKPVKKLSTEEMFYTKEEIDRIEKKTAQPSSGLSQLHKPKEEEEEEFDSYEEEPVYHIPKITETKPTNSGLYLAFVQQAPAVYTIYLVNDSPNSIGFDFKLYLNQNLHQDLKHTITPHLFFPIGSLEHAQLNDAPVVEFSSRSINLQKNIKIKYTKFIKTEKEVPLMGLTANLYTLLEGKTTFVSKPKDLQSYTQDHVKEKGTVYNPLVEEQLHNHVMKKAHFNPEIDLHAEKLLSNPKKYRPKEIFEFQMQALEDFLQHALELNIEEVFIIHGLGTGKLRTSVEQALRRNKHVKEFKNEYIAKYGFGATHVWFT
ncbi:MAG: Smr/MutS family protein [Aureispira sp.]|nr:Smr/MutS family protein [Aureispira sp.]